MPRIPIDYEQLDQLEEDLYEFLNHFDSRINTEDDGIRVLVSKLALASLKSTIDVPEVSEDDDTYFEGDMDIFGLTFGDTDDE